MLRNRKFLYHATGPGWGQQVDKDQKDIESHYAGAGQVLLSRKEDQLDSLQEVRPAEMRGVALRWVRIITFYLF